MESAHLSCWTATALSLIVAAVVHLYTHSKEPRRRCESTTDRSAVDDQHSFNWLHFSSLSSRVRLTVCRFAPTTSLPLVYFPTDLRSAVRFPLPISAVLTSCPSPLVYISASCSPPSSSLHFFFHPLHHLRTSTNIPTSSRASQALYTCFITLRPIRHRYHVCCTFLLEW